MARYIDASCKLCRREKQKLFLKGTKCYSEKCPLEKRNFPPGQHGKSRRTRLSGYGMQLREKQKIRRSYGLLEGQFRNYFVKAQGLEGKTGENLVKLFERRLDNVVYRLGFAPSRKSARQLVTHGHFLVNSKNVDIPSLIINSGDTIQVKEKSRKLDLIHDSMKRVKDASLYSWLNIDKANLKGTFINVPERAEIPLPANEQLVVELYSK